VFRLPAAQETAVDTIPWRSFAQELMEAVLSTEDADVCWPPWAVFLATTGCLSCENACMMGDFSEGRLRAIERFLEAAGKKASADLCPFSPSQKTPQWLVEALERQVDGLARALGSTGFLPGQYSAVVACRVMLTFASPKMPPRCRQAVWGDLVLLQLMTTVLGEAEEGPLVPVDRHGQEQDFGCARGIVAYLQRARESWIESSLFRIAARFAASQPDRETNLVGADPAVVEAVHIIWTGMEHEASTDKAT